MKIKNVALLLLAATMALAAAPISEPPMELPQVGPPPWQPAQASASCEGDCNGTAEIFFPCPGITSASQCCQQAEAACNQNFTGVCSGDAEINC